MRLVILLCAAFALTTAEEPIKASMTQEAMSAPVLTKATKSQTKDEPLPVAEAGTKTLGDTKPIGGCLPDWEPYGLRCFKFFSTPKSWIEAEKHCLYYDANLASIHNPDEHDFLYNMAAQTSHKAAWIGGSDAVKTFTWLWSDGSRYQYSYWATNQPDNWLGQEKCMAIDAAAAYSGWNDSACEHGLPFICGTRPTADD